MTPPHPPPRRLPPPPGPPWPWAAEGAPAPSPGRGKAGGGPVGAALSPGNLTGGGGGGGTRRNARGGGTRAEPPSEQPGLGRQRERRRGRPGGARGSPGRAPGVGVPGERGARAGSAAEPRAGLLLHEWVCRETAQQVPTHFSENCTLQRRFYCNPAVLSICGVFRPWADSRS